MDLLTRLREWGRRGGADDGPDPVGLWEMRIRGRPDFNGPVRAWFLGAFMFRLFRITVARRFWN